MIRPLIHDPLLLARPSGPATPEDTPIAADLLETLMAHRDSCVGMAANMIGERKCIVAVLDGGRYLLMYNPVILKGEGMYTTQEGCLSLLGDPRPTKRYKSIKVSYQDEKFRTRQKTFTGFTAQIIQHEVDHCRGVLI